MQQNAAISVEAATYRRLIKCEGKLALKIRQRYPKLIGQGAAIEAINRYHKALAEQWRQRWEGELAKLACEAMAQQEGEERPPWEAVLDFTVTYHEDSLLSLYTDAYEFTGGAHGHTVRRGDTWDTAEGLPRSLFSFFPSECHPKRLSLAEITAQTQTMQTSGEHLFFDDVEVLIRENFDPALFYLTPDGVAVFYPLYAIAPYVEGFPTFVLDADFARNL